MQILGASRMRSPIFSTVLESCRALKAPPRPPLESENDLCGQRLDDFRIDELLLAARIGEFIQRFALVRTLEKPGQRLGADARLFDAGLEEFEELFILAERFL